MLVVYYMDKSLEDILAWMMTFDSYIWPCNSIWLFSLY